MKCFFPSHSVVFTERKTLFLHKLQDKKPDIVNQEWSITITKRIHVRSFSASGMGKIWSNIMLHCYPCSVGQSPHNRITHDHFETAIFVALLINLWSQVELHVAIVAWLQIILHQEWSIWTQSKFNWAAKLFGLQKARGQRDLCVAKMSETRS